MYRILSLYMLIILTVMMMACNSTVSNKPQTFEDMYPGNLLEVSKIEIRHGGGELKTITDKTTITEWLDKIKSITFVPDKNQELRVGWLFDVRLFEGDEVVFRFDTSKINDFYYESNEKVTEKLAELFNTK